MRDLLVPIQAFDVISSRSRIAKSVRIRDVVKVGNVQLCKISRVFQAPRCCSYLALSSTGGKQIGVLRVELQCLDGTAVLRLS